MGRPALCATVAELRTSRAATSQSVAAEHYVALHPQALGHPRLEAPRLIAGAGEREQVVDVRPQAHAVSVPADLTSQCSGRRIPCRRPGPAFGWPGS